MDGEGADNQSPPPVSRFDKHTKQTILAAVLGHRTLSKASIPPVLVRCIVTRICLRFYILTG